MRKIIAQFWRNETQNVSFVAHQFCGKKQQLVQSFQKLFYTKLPYSAFRNSSFAQCRNFVKIMLRYFCQITN